MSTAPAPRHADVIPMRPRPASRREPLWRNVIGGVLRTERLRQKRTLKEVADAARISMPYLSEVERGLKEASSEVLAAAAAALGFDLAQILTLAAHDLTSCAASLEPARRDLSDPAETVTSRASLRSTPAIAVGQETGRSPGTVVCLAA